MCSSLASNHYDVSLIVADGLGDEIKNNVKICDVGRSGKGRLLRMTNSVSKVYKKALTLNADIYHLHDPELIPIGLRLKRHGNKVIFDSHEDLPQQLLQKTYINPLIRKVLSVAFKIYEKLVCKKFDAIIAATPHIRDKFLELNKNTVDINNYPIADEFSMVSEWSNKRDELAYVGGITQLRGIKEIVAALHLIDRVHLNLAGNFSEKKVESEVRESVGWCKVNELGFITRQEVAKVLAKSKAGIVTLLPAPNHIHSQPIKMFEYMAAGIPVVASNFPLWKEIVEKNKCGICVDPLDPEKIAEAIQFLIDHNDEAEKMGRRGREAVQERYNWAIEEKKLIKLYQELAI